MRYPLQLKIQDAVLHVKKILNVVHYVVAQKSVHNVKAFNNQALTGSSV
jgi:hypothetical protein